MADISIDGFAHTATLVPPLPHPQACEVGKQATRPPCSCPAWSAARPGTVAPPPLACTTPWTAAASVTPPPLPVYTPPVSIDSWFCLLTITDLRGFNDPIDVCQCGKQSVKQNRYLYMQIGMTVLTEYYKAVIIKYLKELLLVQIYPAFMIKVNNCVF